MSKLLLFCLLLSGCQTVQEKNWNLVQDRAVKLRALSQWTPSECHVEATLTQPALARYREMYPDLDIDQTLFYTWRANKNTCDVSSTETSALVKNHKAFMDSALCMLLQVHFVNSPFSGLAFAPTDVVTANDKVQIRLSADDPDLGIFLDQEHLILETKTKARGTLRATYALYEGEWLPESLRQITPQSTLGVDNIQYSTEFIGRRRTLKSLTISVGDATPLPHTALEIRGCHDP